MNSHSTEHPAICGVIKAAGGGLLASAAAEPAGCGSYSAVTLCNVSTSQLCACAKRLAASKRSEQLPEKTRKAACTWQATGQSWDNCKFSTKGYSKSEATRAARATGSRSRENFTGTPTSRDAAYSLCLPAQVCPKTFCSNEAKPVAPQRTATVQNVDQQALFTHLCE